MLALKSGRLRAPKKSPSLFPKLPPNRGGELGVWPATGAALPQLPQVANPPEFHTEIFFFLEGRKHKETCIFAAPPAAAPPGPPPPRAVVRGTCLRPWPRSSSGRLIKWYGALAARLRGAHAPAPYLNRPSMEQKPRFPFVAIGGGSHVPEGASAAIPTPCSSSKSPSADDLFFKRGRPLTTIWKSRKRPPARPGAPTEHGSHRLSQQKSGTLPSSP